jgi:hypothetical protein
MAQIVPFSDLGPFSSVIHANPHFLNAPKGLLRDRKGRIIGHALAPLATRRFGSFGGTEGDDPNLGGVIPAVPSIPLPPIGGGGLSRPSKPTRKAKTIDFDPTETIIQQFGKEDAESKLIGALLKDIETGKSIRAATTKPEEAKRRSKAAAKRRRVLRRSALAGIKASAKGDDVKSGQVAKKEGLAEGLSAAEAKTLQTETRKAIKKHMVMKEKEVPGIVQAVEEKHAASVKPFVGVKFRGTGSLASKKRDELNVIARSMGLAPSQFGNKREILTAITSISSKSGTPVKEIVERSSAGMGMPQAVRQASFEREQKRKARGRGGRGSRPASSFIANPSARTQRKKK